MMLEPLHKHKFFFSFFIIALHLLQGMFINSSKGIVMDYMLGKREKKKTHFRSKVILEHES
jgi:hypothetical protein